MEAAAAPLSAPTRAAAAHGQRVVPSASSWSPPAEAAAAVAAAAGLPPPPRSACSRSCTSAAEAADCWAEVQAVVHRCRRPSTRAWPTRAARPRTLPRAVAAEAVEEAAEAAPSPPSRRQSPRKGLIIITGRRRRALLWWRLLWRPEVARVEVVARLPAPHFYFIVVGVVVWFARVL